MKTSLLNDENLTANSFDLAGLTRERVRQRTLELASRHGRTAQEVWASDWEQAVEDLTRQPDLASNRS